MTDINSTSDPLNTARYAGMAHSTSQGSDSAASGGVDDQISWRLSSHTQAVAVVPAQEQARFNEFGVDTCSQAFINGCCIMQIQQIL